MIQRIETTQGIERRELRANGRTAAMHVARPDRPGPAAILVLHPWWGLNDDVIAYAGRLAEATGLVVGAPDLFDGRVATTIAEAERLTDGFVEGVGDAIVLAAVDELEGIVTVPGAGLGAVGFSFGAAWALWLPTRRPAVSATVVYYGTLEGPSLTRAQVPVLGHFAATDPYESDDAVAAFESTLRTAGREVEIHRYPGTGHWFAEPSKDAYAPTAAELAFGRTVEFLGRTLVEA